MLAPASLPDQRTRALRVINGKSVQSFTLPAPLSLFLIFFFLNQNRKHKALCFMFPTWGAGACSSFFLLPYGSFEPKLFKALNDFKSVWNRTQPKDTHMRITCRDKQFGKVLLSVLSSRAGQNKAGPGESPTTAEQDSRQEPQGLSSLKNSELRFCRQANIKPSQNLKLSGFNFAGVFWWCKSTDDVKISGQ